MTRPASKHERALPAVLADSRVQLGVGLTGLLATASAVRQDRVGPGEARAFRAVNGLPDSWRLSFPWLDDVIARGIRLDGDRLRPPREAKTVAVRDGEVLISDGPFVETKEVICGYDVLECANIDEAVAVAAAHPVAAFGKIEVRPFWP